ncbi:hypothetical protein HYALB_00011008 [Hymenoscyphus albidus]|uniref:Major facilitator superfamily (MFS) profile domain-containing protein n=1 Tax=Hymenoscyphus albidus TaxID=595503 RepID=A0A9N9Q7C1_9HELO|nr:hypothetical protein HYALB_00011008 [Hymenoscyphus albidus]
MSAINGNSFDHTPEASSGEQAFEQKIESDDTAIDILPDSAYMSGWKFHILTFGLCLALFIVQMESSIFSTSIIAITNELSGYGKSSWVFTGFLLTYSGLVIIWAKLSDIFGRKTLIPVSLFTFIVFSGACGGAQTLVQLIIFRAFQSVGGSGVFSIIIVVFFEMVPPRKLPLYTSFVAIVFTFSGTFGPLMGGGYQWSYYMEMDFSNQVTSIPVGILCFILFVVLLPARMPGQHSSSLTPDGLRSVFSPSSLRRVDVLGCVLLLGACMFIVTALQQAAEGSSSSGGTVLTLIVFSVVFWISFVVWQWYITEKRTYPEPVFPWRLFQSRVYMGMILNVSFAGTVLTVLTIQLAQRFQTVNGDSSMAAGVRLLAFGLLAPAGSAISTAVIGRTNIPPIYHILLGNTLQVIGLVVLSRAPTTLAIAPSQYTWQVVTGLGVGLCNAPLILLVNNATIRRDQAVGTSAMTQFRVLGGILGLSIVVSAMSRVIHSDLLEILPEGTDSRLLQTTNVIETLPESSKDAVRQIFGKGYNLQMKIMIGFAAAEFPSTALMWKRKPMIIDKR